MLDLPKTHAFPVESVTLILPIELQNKILDEISQFTRLSPTVIAGKNHFDDLCRKYITKEEFIKYIEKYFPKRFCIFHERQNEYVTYEAKLIDNKYNIIRYIIDHQVNIYLFPSENLGNYLLSQLFNLINNLHDNLLFDVATVFDIYQKLRTECKNYKAILTEKVIKLSSNYRELSLTNFNKYTIINNIKLYLYMSYSLGIISNCDILSLFFDAVKLVVKYLEFDYNSNCINGEYLPMNIYFGLCYYKCLTSILEYLK